MPFFSATAAPAAGYWDPSLYPPSVSTSSNTFTHKARIKGPDHSDSDSCTESLTPPITPSLRTKLLKDLFGKPLLRPRIETSRPSDRPRPTPPPPTHPFLLQHSPQPRLNLTSPCTRYPSQIRQHGTSLCYFTTTSSSITSTRSTSLISVSPFLYAIIVCIR